MVCHVMAVRESLYIRSSEGTDTLSSRGEYLRYLICKNRKKYTYKWNEMNGVLGHLCAHTG